MESGRAHDLIKEVYLGTTPRTYTFTRLRTTLSEGTWRIQTAHLYHVMRALLAMYLNDDSLMCHEQHNASGVCMCLDYEYRGYCLYTTSLRLKYQNCGCASFVS